MNKIKYLKKAIKVVKDYPKKGVNFKDVSSLLKDPKAFKYAIDLMAEKIKDLKLSENRLNEELKNMRIAFVKQQDSNSVKKVLENMSPE